MARQWRICFPGAIYHVMSRGNARQDIFLSDSDRLLFLSLLEEMSERFNVEIYAYVLMRNHYHLLLKTIEPNLTRVMQWFGTTYTRKYNVNNHTFGHLFQGRYKSIIVENEAYLLRLSCYIHRNPLRAGVVKRLADYKWSSYRYYAYNKKAPKWVETETILNQISGADSSREYRNKVQYYSEEEGRFLEDIKHGFVLGSQDFIEEIKERFLDGRWDAELPQKNNILRDLDIDIILRNASKVLETNIDKISAQKRINAGDKENRDLLLYLLWETGRLSNAAIGSYFGLTYSAVSRRVKLVGQELSDKKALRAKYLNIKSQIKA